MKPCLTCGEPAPDSYCDEHTPTTWQHNKGSSRSRGYDTAWDKLSRRARRLQPFCTDCGTKDNLQADHLPSAWERRAAGKPIRLADVDVVCGDCNLRRGSSRPGEARTGHRERPVETPRGPRGKAQGQMKVTHHLSGGAE